MKQAARSPAPVFHSSRVRKKVVIAVNPLKYIIISWIFIMLFLDCKTPSLVQEMLQITHIIMYNLAYYYTVPEYGRQEDADVAYVKGNVEGV